jgi:hypothetical protein
MKKKQESVRFLVAIVVVAFLLSSCDFSQIKIGEVRMGYGSNEDGYLTYNYSTFTGFERGSSEAEAGQTIAFEYVVTVNKGSLLIEWQDPDGEVVWRKSLVESERGEAEILAETSGDYAVVIQGKNAGGYFELSLEIE